MQRTVHGSQSSENYNAVHILGSIVYEEFTEDEKIVSKDPEEFSRHKAKKKQYEQTKLVVIRWRKKNLLSIRGRRSLKTKRLKYS